ncbi:MAG TPA: DinB family protein [Candidatus Limnocylindria bacterium]|nr:DinB family protein [Candidatus Limnocylindria bacterium]
MAIDTRLELRKSMRAVPEVLRALVALIDPALVRRRPAEGEWAPVEIVAHLADGEDWALRRVKRMLAEDEPELEPFDQAALAIESRYIDLDITEQLERFERLRAEHLAILDGLDDAGWRRIGVHGEHGRMSVELYESHVAAEEVDHLAQLSRLLIE